MSNLPRLRSELATAIVLNRIVEGGERPFTGICGAGLFIAEGARLTDLVQRASESWPASTGSWRYPVPVPGYSPESGYTHLKQGDGMLWSGQQGFLRRSLLRHCIDQAVLEAGIY